MDLMDSSSKSLAEDLGSDKDWEKGRAGNDFYQWNGQSRTRFVLSNGELPEKQLHLLRHPKSGNATLYAIGNERVEELLKFDDGLRSVLLGDNVVSDGSLILLAPVNPVLLLLPYLRKYAKDDYVSLKNILVDDNFPSIKLLENVKTVKSSLKHACHCKEMADTETYKYSESLLLDYIKRKIKLMKRSDHCKFDFDHAVSGVLEENLPADILSMVEIDFVGLEGKDAQSNKRLHQDSKISNKNNAMKDSLVNTVPEKRTCLRSGKVFTQ